jgi:hypothetical protein
MFAELDLTSHSRRSGGERRDERDEKEASGASLIAADRESAVSVSRPRYRDGRGLGPHHLLELLSNVASR